jgi:ABC-type transport system involved in multi-copper enzyme maturation permease subunit
MSSFVHTFRIASAVGSRLLRSKFLIVVVLISLLFMVVLCAPFLQMQELKEGGEMVDFREMKTEYLFMTIGVMGWMANLVALILGSTVIRQDIKDGTIFSVLSKPVSRLQYFTGSTLGALFCQTIVWCVFGSVWLLFGYLLDKFVSPLCVSICFGELLKSYLMLALALGWSQRFSPWIAGALALFTFSGEMLAGSAVNAVGNLNLFPVNLLNKICTFPFPDFSGLDALLRQLGQTSLQPVNLLWPILHIIDYVLVILFIAWLAFRQQDLSANS